MSVLVDLWCRATYRQTPAEKARDKAVADALSYLPPRQRGTYLADVDARLDEYADAMHRFVHYNRLGIVRLPQKESGRAFYERQKAVSDFDFAVKRLMAESLLRKEETR